MLRNIYICISLFLSNDKKSLPLTIRPWTIGPLASYSIRSQALGILTYPDFRSRAEHQSECQSCPAASAPTNDGTRGEAIPGLAEPKNTGLPVAQKTLTQTDGELAVVPNGWSSHTLHFVNIILLGGNYPPRIPPPPRAATAAASAPATTSVVAISLASTHRVARALGKKASSVQMCSTSARLIRDRDV